ncbi:MULTISPECIES: RNA methyltransferase [unclassified Chelatococcus]|uniref:class I SAM-dependent RNA methyltransferase n=1 Tax=unclassified Chelatococcus TaxID=2638111 RepID=UPI001BCE727B|nr:MULTISPECIES: RNA methyltransferase [unclassified Chelatococcus]MBS7698303.1 class I SAM-dependent RNA methyltransferase [Chelatococcus sp. YT9]MBX3559160.1 class I SAM-dependent RNA methyltransferase [Chelatococcus sp.]
MTTSLTIVRLGRRGDGVALHENAPVHVPFALPGESVSVTIDGDRAEVAAVNETSPARRMPECTYFTHCGGCATQHMDETLYRQWKRELLLAALARAGIETPVEDLIDAHGEGRRRVTFHARLVDGKAAVGFMAARSHTLVAIDHCPVLMPGLARAPAVARALAAAVGVRKPLDIQLTATSGGLDVDMRGLGPARDKERLALATLAGHLDLARLALHGELIVERRPPGVAMGRALVVPPPGSFLQATAKGEETLGRLVSEACQGRKRVADLFAGCGPFALRLAERSTVHAVESFAPALQALDKAVRGAQGLRPVTTEARDLFRRPLLPLELNRFDAVVFDPPRAGAEAQVREIAASKVKHVIAVSCDTQTFARDMSTLIAAGFSLQRVIPLDQFRYSSHMEIVGVLKR